MRISRTRAAPAPEPEPEETGDIVYEGFLSVHGQLNSKALYAIIATASMKSVMRLAQIQGRTARGYWATCSDPAKVQLAITRPRTFFVAPSMGARANEFKPFKG